MFLIQESAVLNKNIVIVDNKPTKVIFDTILQTVDVVNENNRLYPKNVLDEGLLKLNDFIKNRYFVGELDHPQESNESRQSTVLYKEASHIITNYWYKGNELWGRVETLETPNGKTMAALIRDNIAVGFSLRAFGDSTPKGGYDEILSPIHIVCWDCVSDPSHKAARLQKINHESIKKIIKENRNISKCKDGRCGLTNHVDYLIEKYINKASKILI